MMEEFDIEKDFSKQPYDELPTHKIFPLSENGFKKYIKPKNSFYEFFQKVENDFNSRNRTKNEISNRNKPYVNNTTNDKSNIEKETNKVVKQNKVLCPSRLVKRIKLESKDKELSLSNIKTNKSHDNYTHCNTDSNTRYSFVNRAMLRSINYSKEKSLYSLIESENNHMREILKKKILNPSFLKTNKLPKIKYVGRQIDSEVSCCSAKYGNTYSNHNSYFMGSKYNPSNYELAKAKNRTKRNEFGYLFAN